VLGGSSRKEEKKKTGEKMEREREDKGDVDRFGLD